MSGRFGNFQSSQGSHATRGLPGGGASPKMVGHFRRSSIGNDPLRAEGDWLAYQYGNRGTAAPAGLRPLSDAERAVNTTWRWSSDLATYVSDEYPTGIA